MPARLMKVTTSATALWIGLRASTTPSAEMTATTASRSKMRTSVDTLEHLAIPDQHDEPGEQDVEERERQQHLPGQPHQLVEAEAGERGAQPDEEVQEDHCLRQQPPDAVLDWAVDATQEERRRQQRDDDDGDELAQEVEGPAEAGVFGVEPAGQLRLRLGKVERRAIRLGHAGDHEEHEGQRLREDVPVGDLEPEEVERPALVVDNLDDRQRPGE